MSDSEYHRLAAALGEERAAAARLHQQVLHLESLLLAARRTDQELTVQETRVRERDLALKEAQATIAELEQRIKRLERKLPWWRRWRARR